jgi:lysozyme
MNDELYYDTTGLNLTKASEGCKLEAYQDTGGVWTIGVGHTAGVKKGDVITQEMADVMLIGDVKWAEETVKSLVTVELSQDQFDALVDFVFNEGIGNFKTSTLLRKLNMGDTLSASYEFQRWVKQGDKTLAGLVTRRAAEMQLFVA